MRKLTVLFFVIAVACTTYDIPSTFKVNITVIYPSEFNSGAPMKNAIVKVINIQTEREYSGVTGENGTASFQLRGGNYKFAVSVSEEHEIDISGYPTKKTVLFNGSLDGQLVTGENLSLALQTGYSILNEGFVIKELYVSGSRTPEDKTYSADKFIEIYNNSDQVLYADGLCYGAVHPVTTYRPTPWVDDEGNLLDRCPVWSFIPIVPGTGEEHPVHPGESFVIALQALNHRDDPNGNPNSFDLSIADWEMYVEDGYYKIDVPSVPNMLMQRITKGNAMTLAVAGQVSILFRLPSKDLESVFTNPNNYMVQPGGTERCFMVPWEWVIDGVENVRIDDSGVYKRLVNSIDLGYIQFRGGYEGVSIRRKVKEVVDGRVVYQDTNNSTEDFLTDQEPQPGIISAN